MWLLGRLRENLYKDTNHVSEINALSLYIYIYIKEGLYRFLCSPLLLNPVHPQLKSLSPTQVII